MPITVKGPDGKVHQFPDGATDQQISVALKAIPQANIPPKSAVKGWEAYGPMRGLLKDQAEGGADASALPYVGGAVGASMAGPIGAGLGGSVGESARQVLDTMRDRQAPMTPTESLKREAIQAANQAGLEYGVGKVAQAMKPVASWMMQKVVKASEPLLKEYRTTAPRVAETLLNAGVNVTQGGLTKLQGLLKATNAEIRGMIDASTAKVSKDAVLRRVGELESQIERTSATPVKAMARAAKVADEFAAHPLYKGETIPVQAAQELKVGTYQDIGDAFKNPQKARPLKALARGLKEEIETAVPGVKAKNAEEAAQMVAAEAVASRVSKEASADPLGIVWATHNPSMFIAGLIHRQPVLRSMLANGLWNNAAKVANVGPNVLRSAVAAIASSEDEK